MNRLSPAVLPWGALSILFCTHFLVDSSLGFLPALLPLLREKLGLSLSSVGFLIFLLTASTSLSQPVTALVVDRWPRLPWMAVGMMGGSLATSGIGWLPGFTHVAAAVTLGGILSGLCHPDMAKRAGTVSQVRQGFAVSFYVTGGRLGFALGPYVAIAVATFLGMEWLWIYVFPSIAMALAIFWGLPESGRAAGREVPAPAPTEKKGLLASIRPVRGALAILVGFSVCRTVVTTNLSGFLPTLYVERGMGLWGGATANAVMLTSGSIGVIVGGVLADRYGKRRVVVWGTVWGLIALTAFLAAPSVLGLAVLAIFGAGIYLPMGVSIALAQDLLPSHRGFASSLPLGTTIFIASLSVLPFSWIAGRAGLLAAFWVLPAFLVGSLLFALALPKDR